MKKLLVCLLIFIATLTIAHLRGGVVHMPAHELADRSADAAIARLGEHGVPFAGTGPAGWLLHWFLLPGAYNVSRIGLDPAASLGLGLAAFIGWWGWLASARVVWSTLIRTTGLANIGTLRWWLLLSPPWRPIYKIILRCRRWVKQFRYGREATACWTGMLASMTLIYKRGDCIFLGCLWARGIGLFQAIGLRGPRHLAVVAAAGAGKTRWLMGLLGMLHDKASAFVIDVDGQIVNSLGAALQRQGHKIYNLDPYHLTRFPCASWNALEELTRAAKRHGREAVVRFALTLAEALVQESNSHQPIFSESGRIFTLGGILYVWLFEPKDKCNLVRYRDLLTRGMPERCIDPKQDPFDVWLSAMEQSVDFDDGCDGKIVAVIARAAAVMRAGKTRDGNPFRSNAISATNWLDLPEIAAISQHSDFACEDLKAGNPCVFLCLPVVDIQTKLAGCVRALTMMGLYAFQNMPGNLKIPCTFAIDEAPSLGHLQILETAAPVFRKYGVRLIMITQDLERLRQAYPRSWGGFLSNAMATLWMSTDHQETLEYLSKVLGTTTYIEEISVGSSNAPARVERRERPLMTADQLREFLDPDRGQFIVTRTGKPPLKIAYQGYDKALGVRDYERDLNFREPILRAITRRILNWLRPNK